MAQDFQQFGLVSGGIPQIEPPDFEMKPRGLWCFGIQSDIARECAFLLSKNGFSLPGFKSSAETSIEAGVVVVRSQSCPWSNSNIENTNRIATADPIRFQRLLEDVLSSDATRVGRYTTATGLLKNHLGMRRSAPDSSVHFRSTGNSVMNIFWRDEALNVCLSLHEYSLLLWIWAISVFSEGQKQPRSLKTKHDNFLCYWVYRNEVWCKYCAILEKELTTSLEVKEKWADENWEDMNFKQVDHVFERTLSGTDLDSRKRKYGPDDWENDRALVLLKMNELNMRATRAEQRVLELEQLLRDHALVARDDTCDESDILTSLSQHECFEEQSEMLVCKLAGCNKSFKSSKTLRRHVLQKHSDNARFLVCNQPTVNGVMCRFETIHSGVLSYHRKHSLAHQRREDWHISCPFCQSKFARQHEMDRHQRICKSRPALRVSDQVQNFGGISAETLNLPQQLSSFVVPDRVQNHQHFSMPESNIESSITY